MEQVGDVQSPSSSADRRGYRQSQVIGAGFFLFAAADAFSNGFLPVYAQGLRAIPGLSPGTLASLPISAFWFSVGLAQISAGWWERGRDHRGLMIAAMLLSAAGEALTGLAGGIGELVLWRALCGFGLGAVMILTQDGLLRIAAPSARTRASGAYLSLFFAGTICGTPLGGQMAQWGGFSTAFFAAAALTLVAALVACTLDRHRPERVPAPFRPLELVRNRPLMGLLLFAAIPSRLVNGAFIYYMVPLLINQLRAGPAEAGRIAMVFPLVLALSIPIWSWLVDRLRRPLLFIILGLVVSAAAMIVAPLGWIGLDGVAAAMALLGLGQALGMSPQVTVLFQVADEEIARFGRPAVLGIFRVCERVGLFAGPMLAAALLGGVGRLPAQMVLTGLLTLSAVLLSGVFILPSTPEKVPAP